MIECSIRSCGSTATHSEGKSINMKLIGLFCLSVFAFFVIRNVVGGADAPSASITQAFAAGSRPESFLAKDDERNPRRITQHDRNKELFIARATWDRGEGGFANWRLVFKNNTDKPIGDLKYVTHYMTETGGIITTCGTESRPDSEIRRIIPPRQSRALEINDCVVTHQAGKATFTLVDWQYIEDNGL